MFPHLQFIFFNFRRNLVTSLYTANEELHIHNKYYGNTEITQVSLQLTNGIRTLLSQIR